LTLIIKDRERVPIYAESTSSLDYILAHSVTVPYTILIAVQGGMFNIIFYPRLIAFLTIGKIASKTLLTRIINAVSRVRTLSAGVILNKIKL
jgi:hypothetical protein